MLDDGADLYDDLMCPPTSAHPSVVAGRYEIGDMLGCGHSGQVFAAVDRLSGRQVAVKLLYRGRELPTREVLALRGLRTPGVIPLLDDGVEAGRAFIVMERAHGRAFPGDWKSPTWLDLRDAVVSLLDVLARIHRLGLVHLDLKPDNVLVDDQGRVTVLDLGLVAGEGLGRATPERIGGNHRYAAPEQRRGGPVDARTDLFAVARMVEDLVDGTIPAALAQACAADPGERPPSAEALRGALAPPAMMASDGDDLSRVFVGSDRILPLVTDAGALVQRRAGGDPGARRAVIDGWRRATSVPLGARVRLVAGEFDRLRFDAFDLGDLPTTTAAPDLQTALALAVLAWPASRRDVLSAALELLGLTPDGWDHLVARGDLLRVGDRFRPRSAAPRVRVAPLHHALAAALPANHPRRLRHLIAAGRMGEVRQSAIDIALAHENHGRLGEASNVLDIALRVRPDDDELLGFRARIALQGRSSLALDAGMYAIGRAGADHPFGCRLDHLLRVARNLGRRDIERARTSHGELGEFDDLRLERWRVGLGLELSSTDGAACEAAALGSARARYAADAHWAGHLLKWTGRLRYRQARFSEAADAFSASARLAESELQRLDRLLNAASAALEVPEEVDGRALIQSAIRVARDIRHPHYAGRAAWLERCWEYRLGRAVAPDIELADAAEELELPAYLCGLIALTEAAVGWRSGDHAHARRLAKQAARALTTARHEAGSALAVALGATVGVAYKASALDRVAGLAMREGWPDVDWQVVALVARQRTEWRSKALMLAAREADPERRRDVLAPFEVASLLRPSV